eukprot:CAMPEP_0197717180 /NCGR_PEP_ID=MMETSP1434-20131217/1808_1 /TAXON_ID=265543 /ORGANISM="Minutocellus polymorphus, Strain CCMP3303" /LENGTH=141 /DNA_ID=CAMNT_0043301669 /DNA_START=65 /DNA_END=490 /DNA_ORIENTATION=+
MAKPSASTTGTTKQATAASTMPAKPKKVSATTSKKTKAKYPPGFRGCKTCGGNDHRRCTKHKCPKHPNYDPPKPRLRRGSSYECLFAYTIDEDYMYGNGGGDWSGRPGHRCNLCGRSSEGVGPRRGFDYDNDICGGCCDLD